MAIFKPTYTKPMPHGAEVFIRTGERFARWTDGKGRKRVAKIITGRDGTERITLESNTHVAKYRDGAGLVRTVGTGCRTRDAAESVLSDLRGRAELVKANVLTPAQDMAADHAAESLTDVFAVYLAQLERLACAAHVANVRRQLDRLKAECGLNRLADFRSDAIENWLAAQQRQGMSARTANTYLAAASTFCGWCVEKGRLLVNPLVKIHRADERSDRRRTRRSLTEDELQRLLTVARLRPLADYGRPTQKTAPDAEKPKRSNWTRAPLTFATVTEAAERGRLSLTKRPDFIAELEHRGRERALIYKTLVLTGLRKGELASLTVAQMELEGERPCAMLKAADEKNRNGCDIPLRLDLAADLREWLGERLTALQTAARMRIGAGVPLRLPGDDPLFVVPAGLVRILDRDLTAADIDKEDERGRTVDVHAMRTTFGTHLSMAGVSLRTAQAAMRHSKPELTANTYTDPKLLDVAGAMAALPNLSLTATAEQIPLAATGTFDVDCRKLATSLVPTLVPTSGNLGDSVSPAGVSADLAPMVTMTAHAPQTPDFKGFGASQTITDTCGGKAGDGTRTRNSQLGRLALCH